MIVRIRTANFTRKRKKQDISWALICPVVVIARKDIAKSSFGREESRCYMIPVDFPGANCIYTADKCLDLPALQKMNEEFKIIEVISCHELTDEEIVLMLKQIK